jgi:hypothetical protein
LIVQSTTVFPSVPHMHSAFCPGVVTGHHLLSCHVSVRLCWVLTPGPDQEENTTRPSHSSTFFLKKTVLLSIFSDAIRLFPPTYQALADCGKTMVVQITRSFPPVSQVPSTLCPAVTGFHQPYSYVSVRQCSPVLDTQLVPFVLTLNQEAITTGMLLTIDNPIQYIVRLTSVPPFPVISPDTIR